jgi:hypothetical protein
MDEQVGNYQYELLLRKENDAFEEAEAYLYCLKP